MKQIIIHRFLSTNIHPQFQNIKSIEIEDKPVAEGAFGEVYVCRSINNQACSVPQVIKIFKEDAAHRQDHNYKTIQKIQKKLDQKNKAILSVSGKMITQAYPSLKAIPQISFEGKISGKNYRGFSSTNLKMQGFEEFVDILDKDILRKDYLQISIDRKMLIAYHLVSGFKLLQELSFIHADLKPEALFINARSNECAIIDFDSGTVTENPTDTPNVWGSPNDWVAPEIWDQLKVMNKGGRQKVKVNLFTDLWSVAVGIHYILTTAHPMFYLSELSPRVTKEYFKKYKWPDISATEPYFKNAKIYDALIKWLHNNLPPNIYKQMYNTVNYGYLSPAKRTTYNEWEKALSALKIPPTIQYFTPSKQKIIQGQEVSLKWEATGAASVSINKGVGKVNHSGVVKIKPLHPNYTLVAENAFGKQEKSIVFDILPPAAILNFKAGQSKLGHGNSTKIAWTVKHARKIKLEYNGKTEDLSETGEMTIVPDTSTTYHLILTALDNATVVRQSLLVEVFKKVEIRSFTADMAATIESLPVQLDWEIENASKILLCSGQQADQNVTHKNQITVFPKRDVSYYLKASNDLFEVRSNVISLNVQTLPRMSRLENIVPSGKEILPKFELKLSETTDKIMNETEAEFTKMMSAPAKFGLLGYLKMFIGKQW